ncbi:MAG: hypothetical protein AAF709_23910, partial [Pseudomonadota bacterium]
KWCERALFDLFWQQMSLAEADVVAPLQRVLEQKPTPIGISLSGRAYLWKIVHQSGFVSTKRQD